MSGEKLMTLTEASAWLLNRYGLRRGKHAIYGWLYYGVQGVKLEAVSVAGVWNTTEGALRRFLAECTRRQGAVCGVNELPVGG